MLLDFLVHNDYEFGERRCTMFMNLMVVIMPVQNDLLLRYTGLFTMKGTIRYYERSQLMSKYVLVFPKKMRHAGQIKLHACLSKDSQCSVAPFKRVLYVPSRIDLFFIHCPKMHALFQYRWTAECNIFFKKERKNAKCSIFGSHFLDHFLSHLLHDAAA